MPPVVIAMMSQLHVYVCLRDAWTPINVPTHFTCVYIQTAYFFCALVSGSFVSWSLYLLLCQYSTDIPTGACGMFFCLSYKCKAKGLDMWNVLGLFMCDMKCYSWYFTFFAVESLQIPVVWATSSEMTSLFHDRSFGLPLNKPVEIVIE